MIPSPTIRRSLLIPATVLLFLVTAHGVEKRPENYEEIKSELEAYANADDLLDEKLLAAREKLRRRNAEAVPVLLLLFGETTDDHYRVSVIDALRHNRGEKKDSTAFLAEQLKGSPAEWKGELWIVAAIDFLTEATPDKGRSAALKGLNSPSLLVKRASIRSLSTAGKAEDARLLKALSQKPGEIREIVAAATSAIAEIKSRSANQ